MSKTKVADLNKKLEEKTKEKLAEEGIEIKPFDAKPATKFFLPELTEIKNQQLHAFFTNVLQSAPASFYNDELLMQTVRKAHQLFKIALEGREIPSEYVEAVLGATLISKILKNEKAFTGKYAALYAVATRIHIESEKLEESLPRGLYENIMRIVEAHDEEAVVSPLLEARQGTAEAEVNLFFKLAGHQSVQINAPSQEGEEVHEK